MSKKREIATITRKGSFEQAEEEEENIAYYAKIDWKQSAEIVEAMRKSIWHKVYGLKREKIIFKAHLKEDRDELK